jgi:hypothetical protein
MQVRVILVPLISKDIPPNKDSALILKGDNPTIIGKRTIKKCHFLEGKYFVVIHESIADRMNLSENSSYFIQEMGKDGTLIFRHVKLGA